MPKQYIYSIVVYIRIYSFLLLLLSISIVLVETSKSMRHPPQICPIFLSRFGEKIRKLITGISRDASHQELYCLYNNADFSAQTFTVFQNSLKLHEQLCCFIKNGSDTRMATSTGALDMEQHEVAFPSKTCLLI